jgi:hypothetical protein
MKNAFENALGILPDPNDPKPSSDLDAGSEPHSLDAGDQAGEDDAGPGHDR